MSRNSQWFKKENNVTNHVPSSTHLSTQLKEQADKAALYYKNLNITLLNLGWHTPNAVTFCHVCAHWAAHGEAGLVLYSFDRLVNAIQYAANVVAADAIYPMDFMGRLEAERHMWAAIEISATSPRGLNNRSEMFSNGRGRYFTEFLKDAAQLTMTNAEGWTPWQVVVRR